jgi:hypothetical protein
MSRKTFLTAVSFIAFAVGAFATLAPAALLDSKGAPPSEATFVWVREVGVAIFAMGVMALILRKQPDSPALRAFLAGNAVLQLGLFPIELVAYAQGVITRASGIIPNELLHLALAAGFSYFALRVRVDAAS